MNIKLLEEIVLWLEAGAPHKEDKYPAFDIRIGDDEEEIPWDLVFDTAMALLDIEYYQTDALFEPTGFGQDEMKSLYTPEMWLLFYAISWKLAKLIRI